jgi:hypothetical protein
VGREHTALSNLLVEQIEALGGEAQPIDPRGHIGRCDRLVVFHRSTANFIYFVEVKSEDDVVKPWQHTEHERLRARGFTVEVVRGRQGVLDFVAKVRKRLGK